MEQKRGDFFPVGNRSQLSASLRCTSLSGNKSTTANPVPTRSGGEVERNAKSQFVAPTGRCSSSVFLIFGVQFSFEVKMTPIGGKICERPVRQGLECCTPQNNNNCWRQVANQQDQDHCPSEDDGSPLKEAGAVARALRREKAAMTAASLH